MYFQNTIERVVTKLRPKKQGRKAPRPNSYNIPQQADGPDAEMVQVVKSGDSMTLSDIRYRDPTSWSIVQHASRQVQMYIITNDMWPDRDPFAMADFVQDRFFSSAEGLIGNDSTHPIEVERAEVRLDHFSGKNPSYCRYMSNIVSNVYSIPCILIILCSHSLISGSRSAIAYIQFAPASGWLLYKPSNPSSTSTNSFTLSMIRVKNYLGIQMDL